ncbi:MAG: phage head spike fiber domain-containing protein [Shewanella sp.]
MSIGDSLVYTASDNSYYKIDNTESFAETLQAAALPFPDVWIPFNDGLQMLAGFGDEIKVGGYTVGRQVNFSRASGATYFDKSGALRFTAANEPRFEAEGLLIEGPSTNLFRWDATRIATGGGVQTPVTSQSYQGITAKKVVGGTSFIAIGASKEILKDNTVYSATAIIDLKNSNIPNNKVQLQFAYSENWNNSNIKVDIATLAVVATPGTTGTARIVGDLLVITATASSSASASSAGGGSIDLYYLDSSGAAAAPPADGSMCVVGFQFEEKPFSTSFILTSLSAATRALDKCWMPIDRNSPINTDITMSMEYNMIGGNIGDGEAGPSAWRSICGFYTAGAGFYNWILVRSDDLKLSYCWSVEGERATVNANGKGVVVGRVKLGLISIFNSGIKGTDKQGSKNLNHNQSMFAFGNLAMGSGGSSAIGDRELYGHLRNVRIWHSAMTDVQCAAIG